MTQVVLGENENIESALRRFKRQVSKAGILATVKHRQYFETPRKSANARRKMPAASVVTVEPGQDKLVSPLVKSSSLINLIRSNHPAALTGFI